MGLKGIDKLFEVAAPLREKVRQGITTFTVNLPAAAARFPLVSSTVYL